MLSGQTPLGTEFQVNTYTPNIQGYAAVAAASNGNFIVVWASGSQDGFLYGVFGQRYASGGSALSTEFQVNTYTTSDQWHPAVAAASNGDFVVVWDGFLQDGSDLGVFGQRYASNGSALGAEFQVNTYTTGYQDYAALAAASNGNFVVVWQSTGQDGSDVGVFGQRYASSGSALGTEFRVNTYTTYGQYHPAVAAASNGDFVVVWESVQDGSIEGVFGQRYASSGSALGTEFQVNTYTTLNQRNAAVAAASNGDFVVVWQSKYQDGSGYGVFGRRYASSGSALGTEFQVNTYTTLSQYRPAVAAASNGDFVVVWQSYGQDGSYNGVFAQRYASSGNTAGTEFRVNTYTTSNQRGPRVAAASNGDFVAVWQSAGQDGSVEGVFGQRYGTVACAATTLGSCVTPGKSLLLIRDTSPAGASTGDKLIWKWLKGPTLTQANFGDPTLAANFKLCIYSGTAQTLDTETIVPLATNWQTLSTRGYKYKDQTASVAGITHLLLKGGSSAKILVKGNDGNLHLTPNTLPFDGSADVVVQLSNTDNSNCWQATFPIGAIKKNSDAEFKAKTP